LENIKSDILKNKLSLSDYFSLTKDVIKVRITSLVCLTTALGFLLGYEGFSVTLIYVCLGIFCLAAGASALNHLQEKHTDNLMERTRNRPLPSGRASESFVIFIFVSFTLIGILLLFFKTNLLALGTGLFTFVWYNAVYTNLKKKTSLAVIPGSLVGALPPLAGWAASGRGLTEFPILYICLYFFLWQIPHFWLLLLIYDKDYKRAGFPVLTDLFDSVLLKRFTALWLLICALLGAGIGFAGFIHYSLSTIALLISTVGVIYYIYEFYKAEATKKSIFKMFMMINLYTLLIILILSTDKIIFIYK